MVFVLVSNRKKDIEKVTQNIIKLFSISRKMKKKTKKY